MSPYWFKLVPTVHPQYGQVHRRKPKTTPKRGRRRRRTTSDPICRCHSCHSCHSFCQVQSPELLLFNWLNRDLCDTLWPYIPLHMAFHMALHFTTLGSSGVIWGRRCDWNIVPWWPRQDRQDLEKRRVERSTAEKYAKHKAHRDHRYHRYHRDQGTALVRHGTLMYITILISEFHEIDKESN